MTARRIQEREGATYLRGEVLLVGILMLDKEHGDLARALYRTYLVYRERFLRDRGLMDTIDLDAAPRIRREWREARTNARRLQLHLGGRWTSAIIAHQRRVDAHRLTTEPTATQYPVLARTRDIAVRLQFQEAISVGAERLSSARGDIPEALHNVEDELRRRLLETHEPSVAATAACDLTRYVNDHWALAVEQFSV